MEHADATSISDCIGKQARTAWCAPSLACSGWATSFLPALHMIQIGHVEHALYIILLCGLLAARLGFVVRYWDSYRNTLPDILDIRDGGFLTWPGLVCGGIATLLLLRTRLPKRALSASVCAGAMTLCTGFGAAWVASRNDADIKLPAQTFETIDGKPLALAAFHGKPVVMNLWASWCPPCRHEMPVLQKARAGNQDIVVVFANQRLESKVIQAARLSSAFDKKIAGLDKE